MIGNATAVAEHAQEALKHAEMAQKVKADPHVAEAEKALKGAIEHGNMGHADVAGKAAENAVSHLKMAYKGKETTKEITKEKRLLKRRNPTKALIILLDSRRAGNIGFPALF